MVYGHGEHGYECKSVSGLLQGVMWPPRFSGSKKHQKLFLSEKSFPRVFRHGEDGYECGLRSGHFEEIISPLFTFGVKKTRETNFAWKINCNGFQTWGTRIRVWIRRRVHGRRSCYPSSLTGRKNIGSWFVRRTFLQRGEQLGRTIIIIHFI